MATTIVSAGAAWAGRVRRSGSAAAVRTRDRRYMFAPGREAFASRGKQMVGQRNWPAILGDAGLGGGVGGDWKGFGAGRGYLPRKRVGLRMAWMAGGMSEKSSAGRRGGQVMAKAGVAAWPCGAEAVARRRARSAGVRRL